MTYVLLRKLRPDINVPRYPLPGSCALDIYCPDIIHLPPKQTTVVKTGFSVELPSNLLARIVAPTYLVRGLQDCEVENLIFDSNYKNEIRIVITNNSNTYPCLYPFDVIARMMVQQFEPIIWNIQSPVTEPVVPNPEPAKPMGLLKRALSRADHQSKSPDSTKQ